MKQRNVNQLCGYTASVYSAMLVAIHFQEYHVYTCTQNHLWETQIRNLHLVHINASLETNLVSSSEAEEHY